jgi:hypothetical protein
MEFVETRSYLPDASVDQTEALVESAKVSSGSSNPVSDRSPALRVLRNGRENPTRPA